MILNDRVVYLVHQTTFCGGYSGVVCEQIIWQNKSDIIFFGQSHGDGQSSGMHLEAFV